VTGHDIHLVAAGELTAPRVDNDSLEILNDAIDALAQRRTLYWLGDSSVRLHALASLIAQANNLLPEAVLDTRDQAFTWTQIGQLLNTSAATAARRYGTKT
jgi:hypothetical protein